MFDLYVLIILAIIIIIEIMWIKLRDEKEVYVKSISDFKTWIKVNTAGQIRSTADYIGEGIETGPRKTHLFNTHDFAVSLRWVFAVQHRIY